MTECETRGEIEEREREERVREKRKEENDIVYRQ